MESNHELRETLRATERAEAAPYVDYPAVPWWYPPFLGVYFGVLVLLATVRNTDGPISFVLTGAMVLLVLGLSLFVRWYRKRRGAWPSGKPPREIGRLLWLFVAVAAALAAGTALALIYAPGWWVSLAIAVIVTGCVAIYERTYARAAARVRERLG